MNAPLVLLGVLLLLIGEVGVGGIAFGVLYLRTAAARGCTGLLNRRQR